MLLLDGPQKSSFFYFLMFFLRNGYLLQRSSAAFLFFITYFSLSSFIFWVSNFRCSFCFCDSIFIFSSFSMCSCLHLCDTTIKGRNVFCIFDQYIDVSNFSVPLWKLISLLQLLLTLLVMSSKKIIIWQSLFVGTLLRFTRRLWFSWASITECEEAILCFPFSSIEKLSSGSISTSSFSTHHTLFYATHEIKDELLFEWIHLFTIYMEL